MSRTRAVPKSPSKVNRGAEITERTPRIETRSVSSAGRSPGRFSDWVQTHAPLTAYELVSVNPVDNDERRCEASPQDGNRRSWDV